MVYAGIYPRARWYLCTSSVASGVFRTGADIDIKHKVFVREKKSPSNLGLSTYLLLVNRYGAV